VPPVAGDVAVTEIMFNPGPDGCVTDGSGEYFEVTNISIKVLNLNGIYVEDRNTTTGLPSGFGFQVLASVATLPPLYPGQRFVFARDPGAPFGTIPTVHYDFAASVTTPPVDKSQVGSTQMMINNTGVDGLFIATGAFASLGGTIIESVSFNGSATPLTSNIGVSVERMNLFAPWTVSGAGNDNNNCAQPLVTATYGNPDGITCTAMQRGTPGTVNSTDNTGLWPSNFLFDSLTDPNSLSMTIKGPLSMNAGALTFVNTAGPALAGFPYYIGYSLYIPGSSTPIALFVPGNPGSIVLDLFTMDWLGGFTFGPLGVDSPSVPYAPNPSIIGIDLALQALTVDGGGVVQLTNGVKATVAP
jgi:hypothetical protein